MKEFKVLINARDVLGHVNPEIYGHFSEHLGRCIYEGLFVGENSNIENVNGMRKDVVNALKEMGLPVSLREDYCESIEKVIDRPVDVVLPSHAGHLLSGGVDFLGIADGVPGAGDSFVDPTAWRRMLTAKRAEIIELMEKSKQ